MQSTIVATNIFLNPSKIALPLTGLTSSVANETLARLLFKLVKKSRDETRIQTRHKHRVSPTGKEFDNSRSAQWVVFRCFWHSDAEAWDNCSLRNSRESRSTPQREIVTISLRILYSEDVFLFCWFSYNLTRHCSIFLTLWTLSYIHTGNETPTQIYYKTAQGRY